MIRHSLKLIWRRKGSNALLILEIAISFLVLFAVCLAGIAAWSNARRALGFDRENLWAVAITEGGEARTSEVTTGGDAGEPPAGEDVALRLLREVQSMPEAAAAALVDTAPYEMSSSSSTWRVGARRFEAETNVVSDEFAETVGLEVVAGRWFEPSDEALRFRPVVLNRRFARERFGDEEAIGRSLGGADEENEQRVIGIVEDYRRKGEFSRAENFLFHRQPSDPRATIPLQNLLVRVRPGVERAWEQELVRRLERLAPGASIRVRSVDELRSLSRQFTLVPLALGVVLASFLLLMVLLGLLGVLWQDVTRRRREIGLRRALGADAAAIHRQVMGELHVLVAFGLVVGGIVLAQLPLLGVPELVGRPVFLAAGVAAVLLTLVLASLAGMHPCRLATRIQPATALHHE